jgi:HK97 family phage major capsid protein
MDPQDEVLGLVTEVREGIQTIRSDHERRMERLERRLERQASGRASGFRPGDLRFDGEFGDGLGEARGRAAGVLQRGDLFADWLAESGAVEKPPAPTEFSLGRVLAAMATGERAILTDLERQALGEGAGSGQFLLAPALAAQVIDLARAKAQVIAAGARTVPLPGDSLYYPRLVSGSAPAWMTELAAFPTDTDLVFDRLTFDAETCRVRIKLSEELFEDLSDVGYQAIEDDLTAQLGLALDFVALRGTGTPPQPQGVRFTPGVSLVNFGGANGGPLTNFAPIASAIWTVAGYNFTPNAVIYSARTAGSLDGLLDADNNPMRAPASVEGLQHLVSNQIGNAYTVGTSTDTSEAYVGQWDQLLIGVRPQLGAQVRTIDSTLKDDFSLTLVAWIRADVLLAHEKAFAVVTGLRP